MAYKITSDVLGAQPIAVTDTTQRHPLGFRVQAVDPTYGGGEFIYLKGIDSTAVGSAVVYDQVTAETALAVASIRGPLAIAMSANIANQYGWYQIAGAAVVKCLSGVSSGVMCYLSATAGSLDDGVVSGDKVDDAKFTSVESSLFARVQLDRPGANGNG